MVMFHSYVSLPEGNPRIPSQQTFHPPRPQTMSCIISFQASELPLKSSNLRTLGYGAPITPVTMAILYYIISYYIILYCSILYYTILYYYIYYIYYIYDIYDRYMIYIWYIYDIYDIYDIYMIYVIYMIYIYIYILSTQQQTWTFFPTQMWIQVPNF